MATWTTARLDEIEEISDGRVPWRPVRHHFGIASFGINVFTGKEAGDRIINEHDESDDGHEELYLVHSRPRPVRARRRDARRTGRHARLRSSRGQAHRLRGGARHDARCRRRRAGQGLRGTRLGDLGAARPPLPGRRARAGRRPPRRGARRRSAVLDDPLQRCVHLQPHRAQGEGARAPAPRRRALGHHPRPRAKRHRPRLDSRRAGLQGADRLIQDRGAGGSATERSRRRPTREGSSSSGVRSSARRACSRASA